MSLDELPNIYMAVPLLQQESDKTVHHRLSFRFTVVHLIHFICGCILGNGHAMLGFKRMFHFFQTMSTSHVLLYSVLWSLMTSFSGYFLFNIVWMFLLKRAKIHSGPVRAMSAPHLLVQYEYATYLGIFIGFCLGCTAADIVYGMPWTCVVATILMALGWASIMLWCAHRESAVKELASEIHGTVLPFVVV